MARKTIKMPPNCLNDISAFISLSFYTFITRVGGGIASEKPKEKRPSLNVKTEEGENEIKLNCQKIILQNHI